MDDRERLQTLDNEPDILNCRTDKENADAGSEPAKLRMPIDQWLALRKEPGLKIDPKTAEVFFKWGQVLDPYGIYTDLTEEEECIGRVYFARSPGSDIWVEFGDLPDETLQELLKKVLAGDYADDLELPLEESTSLRAHGNEAALEPMSASVQMNLDLTLDAWNDDAIF